MAGTVMRMRPLPSRSLQYPDLDRQGVQCGKSGSENVGAEHVVLVHSFQADDISGSVGGAEGGVRGDGEDAA